MKFTYYAPTRIVFGKQTQEKTGQLVAQQGGRKVLVHYGGQSAKKSGLLDQVCQSLQAAGIDYVTLGGVVPNPRLSKVREGMALCREQGVDFLLAVGGGSVIDSAKAIGMGLHYDGDVWDFFEGKGVPSACMPIGAVVTLPAAGSEMSESCVITNEETGDKRGYLNDICRPRFAIMNPELTYTLPPYQTACGVADIMMHTMERYFKTSWDSELTDALAEGLLRTVMDHGRRAIREPENYDARAQIMWAGSLAHNDVTGPRSTGDWACHQLEHELSGMFDVAHGAGLAAVWGSWARYVYREDVNRFAQFAVNVMGCTNHFADAERTALEGMEALEGYFRSIGLPTSIGEMDISLTEEQIDELAYRCSFRGKRTVGQFKVLRQEDMAAIYRMAR